MSTKTSLRGSYVRFAFSTNPAISWIGRPWVGLRLQSKNGPAQLYVSLCLHRARSRLSADGLVYTQVIISHNHEFVMSLCESYIRTYAISLLAHSSTSGSEIWEIEAGRMTHKGKSAVVEDILGDAKSPKGSGANTPVRSRVTSPVVSNAATPVVSGAEEGAGGAANAVAVKKKKKVTRNQLKVREERRRLRKLAWLTHGGPKPEDTDSDEDP